MSEKAVRGEKFWRTAALIVLCGLVYYVSYDHGRQDTEHQLAQVRREAAENLELQRREILRLEGQLSACLKPGASSAPMALDRIPLRINQSRLLFDNRVVLTLLAVDSAENTARVQLNFIEEGRLAAEDLAAGGSLKFSIDGRSLALVVSGLKSFEATLNIVELKEQSNNEH